MVDMYTKGRAKFGWWQDWRGECVAIVAAGPSANKVGVENIRDRMHVIVINESYQLCPWADILYSCDSGWWKLRTKEIKKFAGTKLMFRERHERHIEGVDTLDILRRRNTFVDEFLFDEPGVVGSGGHGGFQMTNLSAQFGATAIALVGFDMGGGGGIHWHGKHSDPLRNPDDGRFQQWRQTMDKAAPKLRLAGIDVVNCSSNSMLTAFPKLTINQMLRRWTL